jgi:hypothetical protein
MKTCPHCSITYPDDDLFCYACGNALVNEDGEQPTLLNQKRIVMDQAGAQADGGPAVFCPACGLANVADSKFCRGCAASMAGGFDLPAPNPEFSFPKAGRAGSAPDPAYHETVAFNPQVFTPPDTRIEPARSGNKGIIAALAGACVVLLVLLFALFNMGGGESKNVNTKNPGKTPEPKPTLEKSFNYVYSGNFINKKDLSLTLTLKREGDDLTGKAETGKDGTIASTDTVEGKISENGDFRLQAWENGTKYTGIYTGRIETEGRINGQWTNTDGAHASTFSISR